MRVVQLIDSLDPGGAESMAVNMANLLAQKGIYSALVSTRKEGDLKNKINMNVNYLSLGRKKIIDFKAIKKLIEFIINNKIDLIHAHGSSFFLAVLIKITHPKVKFVWHDHNGNRVNSKSANISIKFFSIFFSAVIAVNEDLREWGIKNLFCNKVYFLPNFSSINNDEKKQTYLKGVKGKRIICLANLKKPKNHSLLIKSFHKSKAFLNNWSLHLIGKDNHDNYSNELKKYLATNELNNNVFIYGSCNDVFHIMSQGNIGVLASTYEGFPVALLEYGLSELAVICSNVGYCQKIIKNQENGEIFESNNENQLIEKIDKLAFNSDLIVNYSKKFNDFVKKEYSEESFFNSITNIYLNCK